jgi:hypothetical protein
VAPVTGYRRQRCVIDAQFHPEGGRFLVREYPKGKKHRRLKLSPHIVAKLDAHPAPVTWNQVTCSSPHASQRHRRQG